MPFCTVSFCTGPCRGATAVLSDGAGTGRPAITAANPTAAPVAAAAQLLCRRAGSIAVAFTASSSVVDSLMAGSALIA